MVNNGWFVVADVYYDMDSQFQYFYGPYESEYTADMIANHEGDCTKGYNIMAEYKRADVVHSTRELPFVIHDNQCFILENTAKNI